MQQPSPGNRIAYTIEFPHYHKALIGEKRFIQKMAAKAFYVLRGFLAGYDQSREGVWCKHHSKKPLEPVMGFEPMTSVLPRLRATPVPHGPTLHT